MFCLLIEPVSETLRSPIANFVLLLAIALIIPPLFERLKLPGLVGLLAAGILVGNSVLGWLDPQSEVMVLLSDIGKIYLMFVAGLEIDLSLFQKTRDRSLSFGALTFAIPFLGGGALGLFFGFGWLAAVLIGSLLASHTLLAYPIVQRLGVVSDEAVTVTVGATIFTDVVALIVLAICLGISKGDFTAGRLVILLGSLGIYAVAVLVGLQQLAIAFFKSTGKDEGNQFLFVMLSVFLSAVVAQLIGVEGIIGAFLAGLAINRVMGHSPVKEKVEFVGSVLFIPMFFINMGLLLDLAALRSLLQIIQLPLLIVGILLLTKLLAAVISKVLFHYSWAQTWTMWSLSIPQVAATLAAALVGYEAKIIDVQVFNSVILLMLVTAVLGPLITAHSAKRLALDSLDSVKNTAVDMAPLQWLPVPAEPADAGTPTSRTLSSAPRYTVVVPVYNPRTEATLIELAALIARYERGQVVALSVAIASPHMNSPKLTKAIARSQQRLEMAKTLCKNLSIPLETSLRIEHSIPQAICHLSREKDASLIVLGMGQAARITRALQPLSPIYRMQEAVLWSAHCPVVVARLRSPLAQLKTVLFPIENPSPLSSRVLRLAQVIATVNAGKVTLLHVCSSLSSQRYRDKVRSQLNKLIDSLPPTTCQIEVVLTTQENPVAGIVKFAQAYDLVVLRSQRHRIGTGLSLSTTTVPLVNQLSSSVILVGEPYPHRHTLP